MINSKPEKPSILFLYSDTGGGHRSAAEAIIEALNLEYGDSVRARMVDGFLEYAPPPFNLLPALYPTMVRFPEAWKWGYRLSNGRPQASLLVTGALPYVRRAARKLIAQNPCNLVASVHPVLNEVAVRSYGRRKPYFVTIVTDLVTTHAFWYNRNVDLCLVPTDEAYHRAIRFGLKPEQVKVVGLPVSYRFCKPCGDRRELRARLGWPQDRLVILLLGGGEGMGPLGKTAWAIAEAFPSAALVIVAGRNAALKNHLESLPWPSATYVYGFVRQMPEFMRAADILVTKAGPSTISEALVSGLPMVLFSRLPGQEDGNVTYVCSEGAGVWAPRRDQLISALRDWLEHPEKLARAVDACKRLARPDAARQIAHILMEKLYAESQYRTPYV